MELFGSNRSIYPTPAKGFETVTPYRALVKVSRWPQLGFSLTFFLMGYIFCGYPGLQTDELLAESPLFRISDAIFYITAGKRQIPIMVMTYIGALKTWLYAPVFRAFHPSYLAVRVPPLLFGSLSIWVCFVLLEKIHSRRAAWVGASLLATDSIFLLTSCFDWGPVALQHLLLVLGILLVVLFTQRHQPRYLALASFCFGLALWDKALFIWLLSGLVVAALTVYPRELLAQLRPLRKAIRRSGTAAICFAAGCSPLILYNVTQGFPTFHASQGFSLNDARTKSIVLKATWEGAALFGYLVNEDSAAAPRPPHNALERFSFWLRSVIGEHKYNAGNWAVLGLLATIPALWGTAAFRIVMFCLVTFGVAWLEMLVTRTAGGSAHHVVLLWPLPHFMIAVAFAEMSFRWGRAGAALLSAALVVLVSSNLLVLNQYLYQFARNGAAGSWTDAIYGLYDVAHKSQARYLAVLDWGILNPLDFLSKGRLPLYWAYGPFQPEQPGMVLPKPDERLLNDSTGLWISHTDDNEQYPGINARVNAFCARAGYRKIVTTRVPDRNGRPVFEMFRLEKIRNDLAASARR